MKSIEKISENDNYTAVNIGPMKELGGHSLIHPKTGKLVTGKVFLNAATGATGTEISFTTIAPKSELGYFHSHNKDEETYLILSGSGYFQVDDDCFPIQEGSVVRIAPKGVRSFCNTSDQEMVYVCIQSKKGSLEQHTAEDGDRIAATPKWNI